VICHETKANMQSMVMMTMPTKPHNCSHEEHQPVDLAMICHEIEANLQLLTPPTLLTTMLMTKPTMISTMTKTPTSPVKQMLPMLTLKTTSPLADAQDPMHPLSPYTLIHMTLNPTITTTMMLMRQAFIHHLNTLDHFANHIQQLIQMLDQDTHFIRSTNFSPIHASNDAQMLPTHVDHITTHNQLPSSPCNATTTKQLSTTNNPTSPQSCTWLKLVTEHS